MDEVEFDNVPMSYKYLLEALWHKTFTLTSTENREFLFGEKEMTSSELSSFYSRMNMIKDKLNSIKVF